MAKLDPRSVYSGVPWRPPASWWQRLLSKPAVACAHAGAAGIIRLKPDQVRLRHRVELAVRQPPRPAIEVCPACLLTLLAKELEAAGRRIIAFEPAEEGLMAYAFIEQEQLGDSALRPEDVIHCQALLGEPLGGCQQCAQPAFFLLVKRGSTTASGQLATFRGGKEYYCAAHGSERLRGLLRQRLPRKSPVRYFNFPYGERGLYIPAD